MFKTTKRRILAKAASLAAAVGLVCMCILPVSAVYVNMSDYGLGYLPSSSSNLVWLDGVGDQAVSARLLMAYWRLDDYDADTTYTFTFKFTPSIELNLRKDGDITKTQGTIYNQLFESVPSYLSKDGVYTSLQVDQSGQYIATLKVNPGSINYTDKPLVAYFSSWFDTARTFTTESWGVSAERDPDAKDLIQSLIDEIASSRQDNENFYSNALEVLDEIKSNTEQTNTKLDNLPGKIGEELDKHDQDVKQEASTEGNDNINQATSALTNALPVASISDAIAPLVTACGYNGTTSVWTFPAMKIPAIAGLFDEIQLNEVQNFDLCSYAEQYIPDELLTLIRSITTVLLIVWAIREIMSLLSGMLGGGDSVGSG